MDMSLSKLQELVMDREAWHAVDDRVTKNWTWLSNWTQLMSLSDWEFYGIGEIPCINFDSYGQNDRNQT